MAKKYSKRNIDKLTEFIYPVFIAEGIKTAEDILSMPGVKKHTVDSAIEEIKEAHKAGVRSILLFGIPEEKDLLGSRAYDDFSGVNKVTKYIKNHYSDIVISTDVCLCAYTSSGHCGIVTGKKIDQDKTLEALAKISLSHAQAGSDFVAPSAMAKRQVHYIRKALDKNGFNDVGILGYSAKFASNFYSPFRDVADSSPKFGNRNSYQLDFHYRKQALKEIQDDIEEGADIVMVKPALAYLDIVYQAREKFDFPLAVYNVSAEYAMVKAAAQKGWIDEEKIVREEVAAFRRAGADYVITYHAKDILKWQI